MLQQHFIEPVQFPDRLVIILHELLDGAVVFGFVAENLSNTALVVEEQPVFPPPGHDMQGKAYMPQEGTAGSERIVFTGFASALSSVTDTEKELGVALVDIGGGKTDVCVYVEGALSYSASLPVGARHITNDIAVGLRVSLDSAEKIKLFTVVIVTLQKI